MGSKYSVEFRKEAVALVQQEGRGVAQVAESLGISDSSLYRWVELYGEDAPEDTRSKEAKRIRDVRARGPQTQGGAQHESPRILKMQK